MKKEESEGVHEKPNNRLSQLAIQNRSLSTGPQKFQSIIQVVVKGTIYCIISYIIDLRATKTNVHLMKPIDSINALPITRNRD